MATYGQYGDLTPARAGTPEGLDFNVESKVAKANIAFGAPLFYDVADENGAYNAVQDKVTVTLSADLVTSNVITSIVKLNGVALTTVANTFATDHDTTIAAHIAALEALTGITCVTAGARAFLITGESKANVTVTTTVTLGGSQATASYAYGTSTLVFGGVAIVSHREFWDGATGTDVSGIYPTLDMVNSLNDGEVWVKVPDAASNTANKPAYVILNTESADYGKFTTTSTNNYDCGCYFKSNPLNKLAKVEVRGIK